MDPKQLKRLYGNEYPAAVLIDGVRLPLKEERRFSRSYYSAKAKLGTEVSRLMDGSASLSVTELQNEWQTWTENERSDFCQHCGWLREQIDFPAMLRFVMRHGDSRDWSAVASSIASSLPSEEAFNFLTQALRGIEIGKGSTSNITQAIALTKHPDAEVTLREHLKSIWVGRSLWDDDKFINWAAFDATTCIAHLIESGASPSDFENQVRQLSQHTCLGNCKSCRNFLSKYYSWLK